MKLLTLARDLKRRKARERERRFVAEGVRTVEVLLASPLHVDGVLHSSDLAREPRGAALLHTAALAGIAVKEISDADLSDAADTDTPQGVLAIARIPERSLATDLVTDLATDLATGDAALKPAAARYLVLDALQDPGNVGTIVRTAAALGVTATLALPGTVDLWNAKVVRSAMGALFVHPVLTVTIEALSAFLGAQGIVCWATDAGGTPLDVLVPSALPDRLAIVVSNEGAGLSASLHSLVSGSVAIRMAPGVESLNVAVATGIVLHALQPAVRTSS